MMDEERGSRPRAHPTQAARPPRAVGVPEQRLPATTETTTGSTTETTTGTPTGSAAAVRPVMELARITLAVIFAMLLLGLVTSFILTRS